MTTLKVARHGLMTLESVPQSCAAGECEWRANSCIHYGLVYGPTPPLWQSEQLTAVMSPKSTGCLNG